MSQRRRERAGPPGLSPEDLALWRLVTRGDMRLPGRDGNNEDEPAPAAKRGRPARPVSQLPPVQPGRTAGLDKRSAQRLRRGQTAIEARLDLHGHTQSEAHHALNTFIASQQAAGRRCLLIITGKGGHGEGVLRQALPRWLAEAPNAGRILAIEQAQPRDGGGGAFYVLLRKAW
ncbi:MAG TPA: Smr/MutS family protein [Alphaproteobacteria bacterium]|nr:Smr/MutS family protein [Alphaproteobacteria bacterium]